jgi:predicted  nucleic acid-binding Zn-ribbon protein
VVSVSVEETAPQPLARQNAAAALGALEQSVAASTSAIKVLGAHIEASERYADGLIRQHAVAMERLTGELQTEIGTLEHEIDEERKTHAETRTSLEARLKATEGQLEAARVKLARSLAMLT